MPPEALTRPLPRTVIALLVVLVVAAGAIAAVVVVRGGRPRPVPPFRRETGPGFEVGIPSIWVPSPPPPNAEAVFLALGPPGPQGQRQGVELRRASNTTADFDKDVRLFNVLQQNLHQGRRLLKQAPVDVPGADRAVEIEAAYRDNGRDVVAVDVIARKHDISYHMVGLGAPTTMTDGVVATLVARLSVT